MAEELIIQNTQEYRDKFHEIFTDLKTRREKAREGIKNDPRFRMLAHPIDAFSDSESALKEVENLYNKTSNASRTRRDWLLWLDSVVTLEVVNQNKKENEN